MMKSKLKIGDKVEVVAGKDLGKKGVVQKVLMDKHKVVVAGINEAKKHLKARGKQPGGIITVNRPLALSNVMVVCPACNRRTRVKVEGTGKNKQRICKQCGVPLGDIESKKK